MLMWDALRFWKSVTQRIREEARRGYSVRGALRSVWQCANVHAGATLPQASMSRTTEAREGSLQERDEEMDGMTKARRVCGGRQEPLEREARA